MIDLTCPFLEEPVEPPGIGRIERLGARCADVLRRLPQPSQIPPDEDDLTTFGPSLDGCSPRVHYS